MGKDRKHMKKLRGKRIKALKNGFLFQKRNYNGRKIKIENEKGRFDTTKDYWQKEIDEKFLKQIGEDEEYLEEKG